MLKWFKEQDEKPPFNLKVLLWNDCDKCRKSIEHAHTCLATPEIMSLNSFTEGSYNVALDKNISYYERYPEYCKEYHWLPFKPSHWAFVNPPEFFD
ncbi:MAG TPA: hypothetical protein VJ697_16525 [Nitrososphaeraceae archaeon]|nr:hypothetical protein [Nitrososphaeraceae archaeon]